MLTLFLLVEVALVVLGIRAATLNAERAVRRLPMALQVVEPFVAPEDQEAMAAMRNVAQALPSLRILDALRQSELARDAATRRILTYDAQIAETEALLEQVEANQASGRRVPIRPLFQDNAMRRSSGRTIVSTDPSLRPGRTYELKWENGKAVEK